MRNRISAAEEFRAAKKRSASAHSSLSPTAPRYGAGLEEARKARYYTSFPYELSIHGKEKEI